MPPRNDRHIKQIQHVLEFFYIFIKLLGKKRFILNHKRKTTSKSVTQETLLYS